MDGLFTDPEMAALFSGDAHVRAMLAFEAALARAQARAGTIPSDAAEAITAACQAAEFDTNAVYRQAASAGTLAIPLVKALTERVGAEAGRYVHWGATSQDAIDTALMLQTRDGLGLLIARLLDIAESCARLAENHRHTPMVGRTLMQQALPITFGLKAARWLALVTRQIVRLRKLPLAIQLGGAVGTLASLGDAGLAVSELLAQELGLAEPDLPWHTERDRVAEIGSAVGIVAGAMAKIASDVLLLAQTEVGEVSEATGEGKGGSSAMPHKRNPVDATFAVASSRLALAQVPLLMNAMIQEHERATGAWQAEWTAIPHIFGHTGAAVERVRSLLEGLQVHPDRMRANLEMTGGLLMAESLTMALAPRLGRPEAYRLVHALVEEVRDAGLHLREIARANDGVREALSPDEIDRALDPTAYLGNTEVSIDNALAAYRGVQDWSLR